MKLALAIFFTLLTLIVFAAGASGTLALVGTNPLAVMVLVLLLAVWAIGFWVWHARSNAKSGAPTGGVTIAMRAAAIVLTLLTLLMLAAGTAGKLALFVNNPLAAMLMALVPGAAAIALWVWSARSPGTSGAPISESK
jgi:hypothetical protein